jgi:phospho-2-dehydro-3-deoxyheptonate aldolase
MPGKELVYSLRISEACIGWEESHRLLDALADATRKRQLKEEAETEAE